jgi:hypothetical protein
MRNVDDAVRRLHLKTPVDECNRDLSPTTIGAGLPLSGARAILGLMIPLPKPRGFWDYALFATLMTGALVFLFRLEASDRLRWADAALACVAAVLFVFGTILARRGEKAGWLAHPTWHTYLLVCLGASALVFAAIYADAYLLHRRDLTFSRYRDDIVLAVVMPAVFLWWSRRRFRAKRQVL